MSSISDTLRVRLPMIVTTFVSRLASGTVSLALLAAASPVVAHDAEGFIVLPGGGARFPGPVGQEANIAEILAKGAQTGGVWGVWRYTAAPEFGPPLHTHAKEDELFYVLSGEFAIQLGECIEVAPAGSFVFIPKDAQHTYRNMRAEPGELLGIVSPAGLEGLFEALHGADPATAEELLKRHAMFLVGPQIDLDALPQDRGAAQAKPAADAYRIGVLAPGCDPPSPTLESFLQALRDRGYTEGQNLVTEWRYSEGDAERFAGLAKELSGLDLDLIVTISTPAALAAKQATKTVPIVMLYVADPQGTGLVPSLARPGGNITGVSDMATELSGKRLSLLKEVVPALSRVAVLWNSADPGMVLRFDELKAAAQELGVTLQFLRCEASVISRMHSRRWHGKLPTRCS